VSRIERIDDAAVAAMAALTEALNEPVIVIGPHDHVLSASGPAREYAPGLRVGAPLALALRAPEVLGAVARARAQGVPQTTQWREPGAVERVFSVRAAPLAGGAGLIAVVLRDLSEARRLERMRTDFVANASHELRTPLASLLGFVETLQGPARDDPRARDRFLTVMHDQASRMSRLIDDLLSLSRVERNLHVRPTTPVDLGEIVRHVVEALGPLASSRQAEIGVETAPLMVAGDRDELIRVAENLIENALKYGLPQEGERRVEATVAREGRDAVLVVRDHGQGVAPEHLPRLTERFYRVDPGQSRAQGGTGLGLALVKNVALRHGGRLSVWSRLGEGAAFRVAIPLLEAFS
jgi:two-component system phosphate regulon sensor histidine kinase PhoR